MTGSALILRGDALRLPMPDESVDLIVSSPPYFALRSYRDGDEHYAGQLGSEPTPQAFLEALWAVMHECWRVLKPSGSCFINLGDKRSGSGGHNWHTLESQYGTPRPSRERRAAEINAHPGHAPEARPEVHFPDGRVVRTDKATRRNAPDRYNQAAFGRPKSKMLLPHRFAIGCEDGLASPCGCPVMAGSRCPAGMHRADLTCVLHGRCRTGWVVRSDIVWQKLNGLPESVTDRCRDSHEYVFHLTKSERYFAAVDEVREGYAPGTAARYAAGFNSRDLDTERCSVNTKLGGDTYGENPLGKLPGSVWPLPSEPLVISDEVKAHYDLPDHFAAFPTELVRRIILGWSPSGVCVECGEGRRPVVAKQNVELHVQGNVGAGKQDQHGNNRLTEVRSVSRSEATITGYACSCGIPAPPTRPSVCLDIFGGTGTTAGVARALGRIGVSVDLSHDYSRLADYLIHRSGRFAKVVQRTHKDNQGSLL